MGKSVIITSGVDTTTANTTMYCAPGGNVDLVTSEVTARVPFGEPGTISNLSVILFTNGVTGNSTVRLRKNGANGNGIVTFGTGETGEKEDLVNTDIVDADDQICFMITHGAATGTLTFVMFSFVFTPDDTTITYTRLVQNFTTSHNASVVFHDTLCGTIQNINTTIGNVQMKPYVAGDFKNWAIYSSSTGRAVGIRMPKNSTDDLVDRSTIASGGTGLQQDIVGVVTIDNDDTISMLHVYGGSGTARTVNFIAVAFENVGNFFLLVSGRADGNPGDFNTTKFYNVGGRILSNTQEFAATQRAKIPMKLSKLGVRTSQNNINTGTITVTLRVNGVDTALSASIPAGASGVGLFEDTTDVITVNENDDICLKVVIPGASGTVNFTVMSMLAEYYPLRDLVMTISHSLTLASTHNRFKGLNRAISHALTLTSTHSRLRGLIQLFTESLSFVSTHSRLRGLWKTITHALTLVSAHSRLTTRLRTITHALTIVSSHTRLKTILARTITHSLTLTSSHTRFRGFVRTITHALTLVHQISYDRPGVKFITHALTFVSTHSRLTGRIRTISHALTLVSTHTRIRFLIQLASHSLTLISDHTRLRGKWRTVSQPTITFTDTHVELRGKWRTATHALTLVSTHNTITTRIRTIVHALTLTSTHTRLRGLIQLASHALTFTDTHSRLRGFIQTISHALTFTDTHNRIRRLNQLASHSLTFVSSHIASAMRYFYIRRFRIRSNKQNV